MIIKRVKKTNQYDVFIGFGWENWTRIEKHGHYLKHINGTKLNRFQIGKVLKQMEKSHV